MQEAKEEVRSRLSIEDVIGEYVPLKRAGRNFKGISPFTAEKTPSFYVSPDKNIWHDFSSNKGGDVFGFVMEVEGMDFRQALEHLARKAGVDLSVYESAGAQDITRRKKRLLEAHRLAAAYYQQSLVKNQHALDYVVSRRALSKEVVQQFQLGYAPSTGTALSDFLKKKGFSQEELRQAGLVNRFDGDLFRGRMMVPLMDGAGQVIGFTGRQIDDDPKAPKYLNTPQTLLYDKGRHVFGLSQAKEAIRTLDYAVIVEGNLDVVSSHQFGVSQVVATAGTALTEHHLKALGRLTNSIRLAFDGDKAGLAATERAIPIAQAVGVELSIVSLPDGSKDPDELVRKDPALWRQALEDAQPVIDWVLAQYAQRHDVTTATGKRQYSDAAMAVIRALRDPVEQEHYLQRVAQAIGASLTALQTKLAQRSAEPSQPLRPVKSLVEAPSNEDHLHQDSLLSLALVNDTVAPLLELVEDAAFAGEHRRAVVRYVKKHTTLKQGTTPKDLQEYDTYVKILLLKADTRYGSWQSSDQTLEAGRLIRHITTEHKQTQKQVLTAELRDAEASGDDDLARTLRTQLNHLIKEIQRAKG